MAIEDKDYIVENNERIDRLEKLSPITEEVIDDMNRQYEKIKRGAREFDKMIREAIKKKSLNSQKEI